MEVAILFGSFALLLILRVPIGISLGMSSLVAILTSGVVQPTYLAQGLVTGADSFPLMAVPFFVLAGELMATGGISRRLLNIADAFLGRKYGGLALVTVVACMFFAAISGSGPATTAAVGAMCVPFLTELGYDKTWSAGLVAVAGGLGVIIPPSIPFVLYSLATGVSTGKLFLAGIIPGFLVGLTLMVYAVIHCLRNGEDKAKVRERMDELSRLGFFRLFRDSSWALLCPVDRPGGHLYRVHHAHGSSRRFLFFMPCWCLFLFTGP